MIRVSGAAGRDPLPQAVKTLLIRLLRKSGESTDIDDVHSIAMYGANHIVFEAGKKYYEVLAEKRFCARKYIKMLCRLSNIETGI